MGQSSEDADQWQLLDDSYQHLTEANRLFKAAERASAEVIKKPVSSRVPFGYPQAQAVYMSTLVVKQWLAKAGVKIYYRGFEKLQKVEGRRNIITPSHPNPFDSIATRYLMYLNNQVVPFTPALVHLTKIPIFEKLLRNNGTFFIDVHRFGDLQYREEINTLMRSITDNGEWLCFYAEGGRELNERPRLLRRGLLKAMVDRPCAFFPMSVSYEKIAHSYISGIGNIYIQLHDPILYGQESYSLGAERSFTNFEPFVNELSASLVKGVNAYTTDLVATMLLHYEAGSTVSLEELERDVDWLRAVIVSREVPYVEVPLLQALQYLKVDHNKSKVRVPSSEPKEQKWLFDHRERILHALYDLADPPAFLAKEFAWTPPPPLIGDDRLRELAAKAIKPLINVYANIITLLDRGVNQIKEIERLAVTPLVGVHPVKNTLRILQAQRIISVADGVVSLN